VSPVTVQVVVVLVSELEQTLVPFVDVVVLVSLTSYPEIAEPLSLGALQVTVAEVALATAAVGAAGVPGASSTSPGPATPDTLLRYPVGPTAVTVA
jgi:hypothetical protein